MKWLQLQRSFSAQGVSKRALNLLLSVMTLGVLGATLFGAGEAYAYFGAPCSTACPSMGSGQCGDIYCKPSPQDPEISCDDWCVNFAPGGTCAMCGSCANDCETVCAGPTKTCASPCNSRSGGSCVPSTCGEEGFRPQTCASRPTEIPVGAPYDCCSDGSTSCTCQDYQNVYNYCGGTTCSARFNFNYTDQTGCATCDKPNICVLDICAVGGSETCEFGSYDDTASRLCYTGPANTEKVGTCRTGVEQCRTGVFLPCTDITPIAEICGDALDNDCDGVVDNGCVCTPGDEIACYSGPDGTAGKGLCVMGRQLCDLGGNWGACVGEIVPTAEICDNLDNDCDGVVDTYLEECYSGPGGTANIGICKPGNRSCGAGVMSPCFGEALPKSSDFCINGKDDDCNGAVDDCSVIEICDGLDNDNNGVVDDGTADTDCPGGQKCEWGECFDDCTLMTCMGAEVCYVNDFRCDDASDPCSTITCPAAMKCYSGSCYDACASSVECDPTDVCYQSGRCTLESNPCDDVQCPETQICYGGGCFDPCSDAAPCMSPDICLDGRCTPDACYNVDCPVGTVCAGGSCFQTCGTDSECDPNSYCYNGRCAADHCEGISCPKGTVCFGGFCAESCVSSGTCGAGEQCFDDGPANACVDSTDPCKGVECGTTELCFAGSCFTACATTAGCDGGEVCYAGRCASTGDPKCDDVLCPVEDSCFGGNCVQACTSDAQCDPNSYCYQGACVEDSCAGVTCPNSNEVCHRGVCYQGCDDTKPCQAPNGCFDGRCAPSACEAQAVNTLLEYNNNHPFRKAKKRIRLYQEATPWIYGRAFTETNVTAVKFMNGAPNGLYRPKKARILLYREAASNGGAGTYALYLTHGGTTSQGPAEAVYSMQFNGTNPDVLGTLNDEKEAYWVTDKDPRHISAMITTEANSPGGILIGKLESDKKWTVKITATLHGDLNGWEFVSGETGEVYPLDQDHPLTIRSEDFGSSEQLSPEIGTPCRREDRGICAQGTYLACENSERVCGQTVFPAPMEFCDGVDNDCDGAVDGDDPDLRVPMVSRRQGNSSGWRTWISFDTAGTSRDLLDYTPSSPGDDRLGSTTINMPGFGAIQENADQSHTFVHRDMRSGRLTFPFIHGKNQPVMSWSDRKFEFDGSTPSGWYLDDMYVAWYEDRKPGATWDEIFDEWYTDMVEMDVAWEIVLRNGMAETDGVVFGVDWYGLDAYFNLKWDFYGQNNPYTWYAWSPGVGREELETNPALRMRVQAARLDETACQAPSATTAGCPIGRYTCRAGMLRCSNATDLACNACVDADKDGEPGFDAALCPSGKDCNDGDATVGPNMPELCNGMDDNCDGVIDITYGGCPNGATECGPPECGFISACVCPDGPEDENFNPASMTECYCGEGLTP